MPHGILLLPLPVLSIFHKSIEECRTRIHDFNTANVPQSTLEMDLINAHHGRHTWVYCFIVGLPKQRDVKNLSNFILIFHFFSVISGTISTQIPRKKHVTSECARDGDVKTNGESSSARNGVKTTSINHGSKDSKNW